MSKRKSSRKGSRQKVNRQKRYRYNSLTRRTKRRLRRSDDIPLSSLSVKRSSPLRFSSRLRRSLRRSSSLPGKTAVSRPYSKKVSSFYDDLRSAVMSVRARCRDKVSRADKSRRVRFFRALGRGNTTRRPEHIYKHNRRC